MGGAARDVGAFEYQRLAPVVSVQPGPSASVFLFAPVSFVGFASDPDGEGIASQSFDLGDGATAAVSTATRSYATPGPRQIAFSATDPTGLTAVATTSLSVDPRAGRCANRQDGDGAANRLVGFAFGDSLVGGRGDDSLYGGAGDDCLFGQDGADRLLGSDGVDQLSGGKGNDRLNGGNGKDALAGGTGDDGLAGGAGDDSLFGSDGRDRLDGGRGSDRLLGGRGNDTIVTGAGVNAVTAGNGDDTINALNRRPDRIDCGRGRRDSVRADRVDRLRHCERVRRR